MFDAGAVARAQLAAGAVLFQPAAPFTFASGLRSPVYCDNRLLLGSVAARRTVIAGFASVCAGADVVAGTATAGIPWAAWAAEACALPMAYVRASAKGHGRGRQIEGAPVAGQRIILLEDTVSTGESALHAVAALQTAGAQVLRVVCIFTWGWPATLAAFTAAGAPLTALATLEDLLTAATAEGRLDATAQHAVQTWAADPHGWQSS